MISTIMVHGSSGEMMAPFGSPGTFIRGKRKNILVTQVGCDVQTPLVIREALMGLQVSCIFTKQQIGEKFTEIPDGSLVAYGEEVVEALLAAGKSHAAEELKKICSDPLDMYVFESETYKLLD